MGYLPAALRNYLVRLGWSHGDTEFFSTQEMTEVFDLGQVGRAPSRFDFAKLENMNGHYMRSTSDADLLSALLETLPYLENGPELASRLNDAGRERLLTAIPGLKERSKTLQELLDGAAFLFAQRPLALSDKAAGVLSAGGADHLRQLLPKLEAIPASAWSAGTTEDAVRDYVSESGAKLGQVAQPLRAALTGQLTSPGIFDVLAVLGKEECIGRLGDQT